MKNRKGQALVEFALISLVMTIILTAILSFGLMFLQGSVTQGVAANSRELLSENIATSTSLSVADVEIALGQYYSEKYLSLTKQEYFDQDFRRHTLPAINQFLLPLYQYDKVYDRYRYPGTLVIHNNEDSILIPQVSRTGAGEAITAWFKPVQVESLLYAKDSVGNDVLPPTAFTLSINFPAQAAAMVEYIIIDDPTDPTNRDNRNLFIADDSDVDMQAPLPDGYTFHASVVTSDDGDINSGKYGLGVFHNLTTQVRPFRVVFTSKATVKLARPTTPLD